MGMYARKNELMQFKLRVSRHATDGSFICTSFPSPGSQRPAPKYLSERTILMTTGETQVEGIRDHAQAPTIYHIYIILYYIKYIYHIYI